MPKYPPSLFASTATPAAPFRKPFAKKKRKTFDIQLELRLADKRIDHEVEILVKIRDYVRRVIWRSIRSGQGNLTKALYSRYGFPEFPIKKVQNRRIPRWKYLSQWMKLQIALLVLGEGSYRSFKLHVHDDLVLALRGVGRDLRAYSRDRIRRNLKSHFGDDIPFYFFVLEDLDNEGNATRPHCHGAIEIGSLPVSAIVDDKVRRRLQRLTQKGFKMEAEHLAGRWAVRQALKATAGQLSYPKVASTGVNQARNVWMTKPYGALFNHQAVDYAFKHVFTSSAVLSEDRVVLPNALNKESRRLWGIIRGS